MRGSGFRSRAAGSGALSASIVLGASLVSGCAVSGFDSDGTRYVAGPALVAEAQDGMGSSGSLSWALEFATLGLAFHDLGDGFVLTFGYASVRTGGLRPAPAAPPAAAERHEPARRRLTLYAGLTDAGLPAGAASAGRVDSVESIGLSVVSLASGTSVLAGHHRERSLAVFEDAHVAGNPLSTLDRAFDGRNGLDPQAGRGKKHEDNQRIAGGREPAGGV